MGMHMAGMNKRNHWIAKVACAALILPAHMARAQSAVSLDKNGNIIDDEYGKSQVWSQVNAADPTMQQAASQICRLVKFVVLGGAAVGFVVAFWLMYRAAKEGDGIGGKWKTALIIMIVSSVLLAPKATLNMLGLDWITQRAGPMSCLVS